MWTLSRSKDVSKCETLLFYSKKFLISDHKTDIDYFFETQPHSNSLSHEFEDSC